MRSRRSQYGYAKPGPEIGVFGGYNIASDLYNVTSGANGLGSQIGLANAFMWGGRLGMSPNRNLGVELAYTHTSSDVSLKKSTNGYPSQPAGKLAANTGDMNFLFKQPSLGNPKATGFFELGFGWTWTDPSGVQPAKTGQSLSPNTLFNWNFRSRWHLRRQRQGRAAARCPLAHHRHACFDQQRHVV